MSDDDDVPVGEYTAWDMIQVPESQAILTPTTEAAIFLTATVDRGGEDGVRNLLSDARGLARSVGFRIPEARLVCVAGIGADVWDRLFGEPRPAALHPFAELSGKTRRAPATPGDLLFHIRAQRMDLCFELGQRLADRLRPHGTVLDEVHGFRSFDERDVLGFVDGTENPDGSAALAAVLIADEDSPFTGGSYVIVQKYLHDLEAWDALPVEEQVRVIGRTKLADLELPDELKPPNSHVALNTIVDQNGEERKIVRFNMPFGTIGARKFGTYFIGYARTPEVIEEMLRNMFIGSPPGSHDRILDFSRPVTGNLFFVPTVDFLDDPPSPGSGADADEPPIATQPGSSGDASLGIGSLRAPAEVRG